MRLTVRAITLTLLLLAVAATASADTVSLTITDGGSNTSGGVYVGPYNFTSGGQSLQLICDTFANDVFPPETWNAQTTSFSNLSGTLFGSANQTKYLEVGYLAEAMFANLSNPGTVADIQWAIWDIFDAGSCGTGVSNCDPYGTPNDLNGINGWVAAAIANPGMDSNYSNLVIYSPVSGWPAQDGVPQEYIGQVPEPGSLMLMGSGLFSLLAFRRRLPS